MSKINYFHFNLVVKLFGPAVKVDFHQPAVQTAFTTETVDMLAGRR